MVKFPQKTFDLTLCSIVFLYRPQILLLLLEVLVEERLARGSFWPVKELRRAVLRYMTFIVCACVL